MLFLEGVDDFLGIRMASVTAPPGKTQVNRFVLGASTSTAGEQESRQGGGNDDWGRMW